MKIGVIGCGAWGRNLVRNFHELGALGAVCDENPATASAMAQGFQAPAVSVAEMLANPQIGGVAIAAPAVQHARLVRAALEAGKHVFVEKPLALSTDDAEPLPTLAESRGLTLMVGHLLQYHPAFVALKDLVRRGDLGRVRYVASNRLSLGKVRREEDVLWSFAPHDISMILSLIRAEPTRASCVGSPFLHPQIADMATAHLEFADGARAHVCVSWLHPFKEQKLTVIGDCGMASFDDGADWAHKLTVYPHRVDWVDGMPRPVKADGVAVAVAPDEPLRLECQHFLDCAASGAPARTDGREGLRVLRALQAAARSMREGAAVEICEGASVEICEGEPVKTPAAAPRFPAGVFIHETALADDGAEIGEGSKIWHFAHILSGVRIGKDCSIGQNVMIGPQVTVGDHCKIQNNVSLYKGVTLEDGVFCGPSCVFTNVLTPRAEVERKDEFKPTLVRRGATIGANATIVCGNTLGPYCMVGAGAVVTRDVPAHALVVGAPARRIGWVSRSGDRLGDDLVCPRTGERYVLTGDSLTLLNSAD